MEDLQVSTISLQVIETTTQLVPVDAECDRVDPDLLIERFWLCVVIGGAVSVISIIENLFIFALFITSRQHRNSYNLYLLLLAFFDVFMGISYIALMSVSIMINFTSSYTLKWMFSTYLRPMLTISHIAMTASTFLITFAAIERYAITVTSNAVKMLQRNRPLFVVLCFVIGVFTKGSIFFEIYIERNPNCTGHIQEFQTMPSDLVRNPTYTHYFKLHFRTLTTIIIPFFFLTLITGSLVWKLNKPIREKNGQQLDVQHVKQKKARIRAATRSLVILIMTYLMSNVLGVVISFAELYAQHLLRSVELLYVLSVDVISFLSIVACALRLPIYLSCQPLLRKEAKNFIATFFGSGSMKARLLRNDSTMERETFSASQTLISSPNEKVDL